jgi:hypothetical protein
MLFEIENEYPEERDYVIYPYGVPRPANALLLGRNGSFYAPTQVFLPDVVDGDLIRAGLDASCRSGLNPFESRENVVKSALAPLGRVSGDRVGFCLDLLGRAKGFFAEGADGGACARILTSSAGILKPEGVTAFLKGLNDARLMSDLVSQANTVSDGFF